MREFTFEEKAEFAAERARKLEKEKHFFAAAQPFFPLGFTVVYRNPGHWDVHARQTPGLSSAAGNTEYGQRERAFRIRGEPGNVIGFDERWDPHRPHPREPLRFQSVTGAMLWIVEELMQEPQKENPAGEG